MSLIYRDISLVANQPQTHAIIIGVGDYPHLRNGSAFRERPATSTMGLGQLTSSPISAKAFSDWMVNNFNNPNAPLGTVELLLSPSQSSFQTNNGGIISVESATMDNIQDAFDRWYERCNTLKENIAIFYFCGHGVEYEKMALLTEDFGANSNRPWKNAIDFNLTFMGMGDCKAQTQCYFIDSCRESPIDTLRMGFDPQPLKTPNSTHFPPRAAPVVKATILGNKAFAPVGGVSYFTEILIKCFNGFGAAHKTTTQAGQMWKVTTDSLSRSMGYAMMQRGTSVGKNLFISQEGLYNIPNALVHLIPDPAQCIVQVTCLPVTASKISQLSLSKINGPRIYNWLVKTDLWEEVESGQYDVLATIISGTPNSPGLPSLWAYPPYQEYQLDVQ